MKSKYVWLWTALIFLAAQAAAAVEISVGAFCDLTAATSDTGKEYALGVMEAVHYVNDTGGINGNPLKLYPLDYGYRIPELLIQYRFLKEKRCAAILGWGTADTEVLALYAARDHIPYVTAYDAAHFCNPVKTPYTLFFAPDYSSQARALITAWFDKKWPAHPDFGKRKPRLVCAYMAASPFSSNAVKAAKDQAALLGFDIGPDQDISLFAVDARHQIEAMKEIRPDAVLHANTFMSVATTLRDARTLGLAADPLILSSGFDERLSRLPGNAAEGALGCGPTAFFAEPAKFMDDVVAYAKKYNPGIPPEHRTIYTVQAWANVLGLAEAMKRADKSGGLSGENILRHGFETMKNLDTGLGLAPVSITSTDHRTQNSARIYEIRNRKFQILETVDLKSRWPEKWDRQWLGW